MNDDIVIKNFNKDDLFKQDYFLHNKTLIYIKDHLKLSIDINYVIKIVEEIVPEHVLNDLDDIFIGKFHELTKKNIEILYKEGALYISNEYQTTSEALIYSILLGIGHSIVLSQNNYFLNDGMLMREFLTKRILMAQPLKPFIDRKILDLNKLINPDYYDILENVISSMKETNKKEKVILLALQDYFITNFGFYSLTNYVLDGYIEYLYQKDMIKFKKICPQLYNKIQSFFYKNDIVPQQSNKENNKHVRKNKNKYSNS